MTNDERQFLKQRLEEIASGLKEGVHREVARLRREGIPVYISSNGQIIRAPATKSPRPGT